MSYVRSPRKWYTRNRVHFYAALFVTHTVFVSTWRTFHERWWNAAEGAEQEEFAGWGCTEVMQDVQYLHTWNPQNPISVISLVLMIRGGVCFTVCTCKPSYKLRVVLSINTENNVAFSAISYCDFDSEQCDSMIGVLFVKHTGQGKKKQKNKNHLNT